MIERVLTAAAMMTWAVCLFTGGATEAWAQSRPKSQSDRRTDRAPAMSRDLASVRDWTVHFELRFLPFNPPDPIQGSTASLTTNLHLDAVELLFPLLGRTSMSDPWPEKMNWDWQVENRRIRSSPRIETGYQGLTDLGVWPAQQIDGRFMTFIVEVAATCYETRVNEAAARAYGWPEADWSPELALMLEPQLFVESLDPGIAKLVEGWTHGRPRAARPYDLAKSLAGSCIDHVQITRDNYSSALITDRTPTVGAGGASTAIAPIMTGLQVVGAATMAQERQGAPADLACLYVAACRAAGLPSRVVIGFDINASKQYRVPVFRIWAEFFLPMGASRPGGSPDEVPVITTSDGQWVPVDIANQKSFSSQAPPLARPWRYFGHNEDFDFVPPIAHHFVPPADVSSLGAPAMWGWRPRPLPPAASAELRVWAFETPKTSQDMNRKPSQP